MQTKVRLLGHPVHQMLIVFPLGLLATAVLFDIVHLASGRPVALALVLSFAGAAIAMVTAWLGGELVDRLGVGVYDDANVDAPNSLREHKLHSH